MGLKNPDKYKKIVEGVIGKTSPNMGTFLAKDTDKDGVMNVIDCQPFNPRKQGIIHRARAFIAEKRGNTERAEEIRMQGQESDARRENTRRDRAEARKEVLGVQTEERQKQRITTARFREQERGKRQRTAFKERKPIGSGLQSLGASLGQAGFSARGSPTAARRELGKPQKRFKTVTKLVPVKGQKGVFKKVTRKVTIKSTGTTRKPSQPKNNLNTMLFGGGNSGIKL